MDLAAPEMRHVIDLGRTPYLLLWAGREPDASGAREPEADQGSRMKPIYP